MNVKEAKQVQPLSKCAVVMARLTEGEVYIQADIYHG